MYHQLPKSEPTYNRQSDEDDDDDDDVYMLWSLSCHYNKVNRQINNGIFYTCVAHNPEALGCVCQLSVAMTKFLRQSEDFRSWLDELIYVRDKAPSQERQSGAKLLFP